MDLQGREKCVDIYGEPRVEEFLRENMRIINFRLTFDFTVRKIEKDGVIVRERDYQVSCCEALHSIPSLAYCVEEFDRPGIFNVMEAKRLGIPEGNLYINSSMGKTSLIRQTNKSKSHSRAGPER
jgi:ribonuclease Z